MKVELWLFNIIAVVTQHTKSYVLLNVVTFGYMFRPLFDHHQAKKNSVVKVHSTTFPNGIPLFALKECIFSEILN